MHGRRLATTEEIVALVTPGSEEAVERLESWTSTHGIDLALVDIADDVTEEHYSEARATLGVTVGGDGAFLEGVRAFAPRGIPLLGVNTGTLAFLARINPDDLEAALTQVLRGRARIDDRQQLHATGGGIDDTGVNDVMIQPVPPENPFDRKIARLHVFAGEEYVGQYDGSGLAINTPTGSTGIALSADGPVHHPNDNFSLQITPLHTHKMGVRPLVLSAETEITVVPEDPVQILLDGGRLHTTVGDDEIIDVTGADQPAHIVRTEYDNQFFSAIAGKLGWGIRTADAMGPTDRLPEEDQGPDDFLERAADVAVGAAQGAGEPLRELHGQVESVEFKTDKADIVTEADYQAEHVITTAIENEFPNHAIRSEETVQQSGKEEYTWLIDPLDGTGNFAHGNPNYSVSIAMLDGSNTPIVGVVYAPETDEVFRAVQGRGATLDGHQISPTDRSRLDESMLLSGYDPQGDFLRQFYDHTRGVRRIGSAALNLCYVASGSADALWENDTYPWDVAAGLVVLREAGGRATDHEGHQYELRLDAGEERTPLLASNGPLHDALLEHFEDGNGDEPE